MNCSMPGFPVLHGLLEFAESHVHWAGDATQPSHPLSPPFSSCPQSFPASRSFPVSQLLFVIRWPKYWSFSIIPSSEHLGLISFRIDWFDLLAVQEILKSLLQHHSLKILILWPSVFFYCSGLTSIYDYWKNHSFNYTDLCRQSDISAFLYAV